MLYALIKGYSYFRRLFPNYQLYMACLFSVEVPIVNVMVSLIYSYYYIKNVPRVEISVSGK